MGYRALKIAAWKQMAMAQGSGYKEGLGYRPNP